MSESLSITKDIATIASPFIKKIIDIWLLPKIERLYRKCETRKNIDDYISLGTKFEDYLIKSYEYYSYMNTIVFQNEQMRFDDLYYPLHVECSLKTSKIGPETKVFKIDEYHESFAPFYKKILITDTAGMGKSTLLKCLFLSCIKKNEGIPIFIELRKLSKDKPILDELLNELNGYNSNFNKDFILEIIKSGDFIFFLDGFDEIPEKEKEYVEQDIHNLILNANKNYFIMSSRPESSLASFGSFQKFTIKPLKSEEAYELLKKYDSKDGKLSDLLIKKIKEPNTYKNVKEFLANPMLVSLLYKAFDFKPDIPLNKRTFYRQVYDSLYESHDFTKGHFKRTKACGLDIDNFHKILRAVGYFTFKAGKIEFSKDEIISHIKSAKDFNTGIIFSESSYLDDLIKSVPFFNKVGLNYKWAHKSIQDYFTAEFICSDSKDMESKILKALCINDDNSKYSNVIDLCYDADYKTFRRVIIYHVISDFINYYNLSYKNFNNSNIDVKEIHLRKTLTFGEIYFFTNNITIDKTKTKDILSALFNALSEKLNSQKNISLFIAEKCYMGVTGSYVNELQKILFGKKESFIYENIQKEASNRKLSLKKDFDIYLDDSPDNYLNSKTNFTVVNNIIMLRKFHVFNIKKCIELKRTIEKEIDKEKDGCVLLNGLTV